MLKLIIAQASQTLHNYFGCDRIRSWLVILRPSGVRTGSGDPGRASTNGSGAHSRIRELFGDGWPPVSAHSFIRVLFGDGRRKRV